MNPLKAAALLLLLAACGGQPAGEPKGPASQERSAAFKRMMPEFSAMGKMVKGDETYNAAKFQADAAAFADAAQKPFEHFQNDPQGNGDALPAVWQQPEAFKREQDAFLAAVAELNAKAQGGSLDDIKAAYSAAGASCKSCHDSYRRPK
ncbi:c-type cytochrome [Neisseria sp. 23W00296]|uniref:c-type cytochrome n=1 Tax=unclassified Neisseria TaxID=2623750 RepID=UPI00375767E2